MTLDEIQPVWGRGQLLAFSGLDGPTDFEHGLVGRTRFDGLGIEIKWPANCMLKFCEAPPEALKLAGDHFVLRSRADEIKGAFLDAHHILIEGPCTVDSREPGIAVVQEGSRTLVAPAGHLDRAGLGADLDDAIAARRAWLNGLSLPDAPGSPTTRTLTKALSVMKTQVYTPEGMIRHRWTTPDRWPHRRMWLWDSVFHAIGWRHVDVALAREMLSAVLDGQREDGFVPLMADPADRSPLTQPPVLALGVKMVHDAKPAPEWIREVYPKLAAYVTWDLEHRDSDGFGLVEWAIDDDVNCRSGESGMDNSPRFDSATQLDATDFNAYLAHEAELLSGFAHELAMEDDARKWAGVHRALCAKIDERLWDEDAGFYMDYDVTAGRQTGVLAFSGFLPLICGAPSPKQARRLASHLENPEAFGTALPIPSVAKSDTEHYVKDMWRGPVWMNLNWLITYGLRRYGMHSLAESIEQASTREIERLYLKYGALFEFFDDRKEVDPPELLRKGTCDPTGNTYNLVFHDYGWTATLYADWIMRARRSA